MTTTLELSRQEQKRSTTIAAAAFVFAPIVLIAGFLAGGEAGYESVLFVWSHTGALLSAMLLAIGGTALLYGGARRLGIAGLVGTGFAYVMTAMAALWLPIAWQATVFAQTGSSSLGVFTSLFSPLGSAYFAAVVFMYGATVAAIAVGLFGTGLVSKLAAAPAAVVGLLTAGVMLYALSMAVPEPTEYVLLALLVPLTMLPIGGSLYRRSDSGTEPDETDPDVDAPAGADD